MSSFNVTIRYNSLNYSPGARHLLDHKCCTFTPPRGVPPEGGRVARMELTGTAGLSEDEAQAAGTVADASSTVAVEAASGALSRAFASPGVVGPPWVQECLSPAVLAQMGRDLIRSVVRRRILTPWTPTMSIG